MSNQLVKMRREVLAPCMTCPLCHRLFRDATTISECLHTFCRTCIYKKLYDEDTGGCPVCNINLGCVPTEKLRADHNLQDMRAKLFPYNRRIMKAPEVVTPVMLPAKRKERCLSSLVVSTPRVSTHSGMTGRRSKSISRKVSRSSNFTMEKSPKKYKNPVKNHPKSSNSPSTLYKLSTDIRQNSIGAEPSSNSSPNNGKEDCPEPLNGEVDPGKPLNCLVEEVNKSKSPELISKVSVSKSEALHSHDKKGLLLKTQNKEHGKILNVQDAKKGSDHATQEAEEPKKLRRMRQKKTQNSGEFRPRVPPQAVLDASSGNCERRNHPIWFSLVASNDQEGSAPLPQISASYLRIKDGNISVSFIQKYLKKKLNLASEDEVEIKCKGQPVIPSLTLNDLVDLWLQTTPSERVSARIGSTAKEFIMVLGYGRKISST